MSHSHHNMKRIPIVQVSDTGIHLRLSNSKATHSTMPTVIPSSQTVDLEYVTGSSTPRVTKQFHHPPRWELETQQTKSVFRGFQTSCATSFPKVTGQSLLCVTRLRNRLPTAQWRVPRQCLIWQFGRRGRACALPATQPNFKLAAGSNDVDSPRLPSTSMQR